MLCIDKKRLLDAFSDMDQGKTSSLKLYVDQDAVDQKLIAFTDKA